MSCDVGEVTERLENELILSKIVTEDLSLWSDSFIVEPEMFTGYLSKLSCDLSDIYFLNH